MFIYSFHLRRFALFSSFFCLPIIGALLFLIIKYWQEEYDNIQHFSCTSHGCDGNTFYNNLIFCFFNIFLFLFMFIYLIGIINAKYGEDSCQGTAECGGTSLVIVIINALYGWISHLIYIKQLNVFIPVTPMGWPIFIWFMAVNLCIVVGLLFGTVILIWSCFTCASKTCCSCTDLYLLCFNPAHKDKCSICSYKITTANEKILSCKHVFHETCITNWKNINNTCPLCRAAIQV